MPGFFDDRADVRVDGVAMEKLLGRLSDAASYIRENSINEVYITLPLGSQPRIIELLEQLQGTTASVFYVPDVFPPVPAPPVPTVTPTVT